MYEEYFSSFPLVQVNYGNEGSDATPVPWSRTISGGSLNATSFRRGENLAKYLDIIKSGGDATTSFDGCIYHPPTFRAANYELRYTKASKGSVVFTRGFTGSLSCVTSHNNDSPNYKTSDNLALQQLYNRIAAVQSDFDGLVFLGELGETIAMLRSPMSRLRGVLSDYLTTVRSKLQYKTGKLSKVEIGTVLEQTWLEYSFGLRPLISDISGIAGTLAKMGNDRGRRIRLVATGKSDSSRILSGTLTANSCPYDYQSVLTSAVSVRYYVGFSVDMGKPLTTAQLWGFRPERFVPTIYELIPYSWLVDYFSNLGAIVEALSYLTLKPTYICRTTRVVRTKSFNSWPKVSAISDKIVSLKGDAGTSLLTNTLVSRRKVDSLVLPSLEFKIPVRWDQWANLGALVLQQSSVRKLIQQSLKGSAHV